jgi:hypothetical protein
MEAGFGNDRRALLDAKLTELGLYAKELYPDGAVEMSRPLRRRRQRRPRVAGLKNRGNVWIDR